MKITIFKKNTKEILANLDLNESKEGLTEGLTRIYNDVKSLGVNINDTELNIEGLS